ncbi:MAG: ATP-binding cassette domain-containing protein [Bacteroidetes bacterium]|jgi:putrescine transport system ATP-binding protein|nr:ATP-binding cassette domain-containing protein [Bacteroidota bacterium]
MIELRDLRMQFGTETVLDGVDLRLADGETLAVLGASGSGKTTLLKVLAGLHEGYTGSIQVDGKAINHLPPQQRGVVYLYQEALLFPHLTVRQNVAFGLELRNEPSTAANAAVAQMLADLQLTDHADKYPAQLSGGQRQRVAFGRAAIIHPAILLLDEPFASLDFDTRNEMQQLFKRIVSAQNITTLFVTHDAKEALRVGDRFAHMAEGTLTVYPNRQSFIQDEASGVQSERAFWQSITAEAPPE